nr:odorant binding protein 4 [Megachile saussurei]
MKSLLVIGCLLLVADVIRAETDVLEVLREQVESCAEDQNIPTSELSKFHDIELEGDDRKKMGCLKACILKRTEIFDGTTINPDKYQEIAEKVLGDDTDKIAKGMEDMKACVEEVSVKEIPDECDAAYEFTRCVMLKRDS